MSTAIQKHEPSIIDTLTNAQWTRDVFEVIRKLRVPKGCTEEEFYVYLKQCQASGLNPLLGHAYCVPRRTNIGTKQAPNWVTNHVFQPAIDGMRARAAEFPDFRAVDSAAIYEKDLITIDKGTGVISHKTNPAGQRGRLVGAWGRVRKAKEVVIVELPVGARAGDSSFWQADPGGMLAKCCEAAALRKAYPRAFGGMHIREEMPEETSQPARAEVVLSAANGTPAEKEAPALPAVGPVVEFGEWKGRPIVALTAEEKAAAIDYGQWQLEQNPKMKQKIKDALTENMQTIQCSIAASVVPVEEAEVVGEKPLPISHPDAQPPEPGSEG